ncbi:MAG: Gfo/Idh/MocA family protein [Methanobacteriota archaeon]
MKIAHLGLGSIGRRHVRNVLSLGEKDLVLFDPDAATRETVRKELRLDAVATLDEVWREAPDVVFVTTPPQFHADLLLAAARKGCHLFVEKPLSHDERLLDDLSREVTSRRLVTLVGCNMRFHPGPAKVKETLASGAIGAPLAARIENGSYLPGWRPHQDHRHGYAAHPSWGGIILDGIHEIDLALWYFGDAKVLAAAARSAESIGLPVDGLAEILLRHENGVISSVQQNFVQRNYKRRNEVVGTEGTVDWDWNTGETRLFDAQGKIAATSKQPADWTVNQMYVDEIAHFLGCARAGTPTTNPVEAGGRAALRVALAAREASGWRA